MVEKNIGPKKRVRKKEKVGGGRRQKRPKERPTREGQGCLKMKRTSIGTRNAKATVEKKKRQVSREGDRRDPVKVEGRT